MAKWIEFTGSDGQIEEIQKSEHGYIVRDNLGLLSGRIRMAFDLDGVDILPFKYLICEPHPYADLIKIWADTGCPVWFRFKATKFEPGIETEEPDWFNDEFEFKLAPFED